MKFFYKNIIHIKYFTYIENAKNTKYKNEYVQVISQ